MGWLNINGNWIGRHSGKSWQTYWTQQKLLEYTSRSGLDLLETKSGNNRNAKIIPSCAKLQATDYLTKTVAFAGSDSTGYLEFRAKFGAGLVYNVFSSCSPVRTDRYIYFSVSESLVLFGIRDIAGTPTTPKLFNNTNAISDGWHTVRISTDGSTWSMTVDGINNPVLMTYGTNTGQWFAFVQVALRPNISIGARIMSSPIYSTLGYIDYIDYNNTNKWIITGEGSKVFDIIGGVHLDWTGTDHLAYDIDSTQLLLNNGFSVWIKAGSPNEYVPYKNGSPFDVSAFLVGYTKLIDHPGGAAIYNYAPSLVDFDYSDSTHADLIVFDKSNSTYHIATAGMNYYDAVNPYRWRQDELASPQIYSDTYKNIGYKGRMMIKGTIASSLVTDLQEIYVLRTDQTGDKEWRLAQLCAIEDLVVQAGNEPVYDGDNYLTWI